LFVNKLSCPHVWRESPHTYLQAQGRSVGDARDRERGRGQARETGGRADDSAEADEEEAFGGGAGGGRSAGARVDAIEGCEVPTRTQHVKIK